jgi:hypothetical protein
MREDMYKVIVERPRSGSRWIGSREGRLHRASEEVSSKQGMRQGYDLRKSLNENLNPLKRFIASRVNRPWNKVYAEICTNIDSRNTVQQHIFAHLDQFVDRHTKMIDGEVYITGRWGGHEAKPLRGSDVELYVHPRTGILLRNRHRKTYNARKAESREQHAAEIAARRIVLSEHEQLLLLDGFWYRVELARLPMCDCAKREANAEDPGPAAGAIKCWDVVRRQEVSKCGRQGQTRNSAGYLYGRGSVYATSKRQLSERELRQYGLKQKGRDFSRPF